MAALRLITLVCLPAGLRAAAQLRPGKLYFVDSAARKILRANLDGTSVEQVVTGLGTPVGIAVHGEAGHIYWTDAERRKIQRADLDGTNVKDLVSLADGSLASIALDKVANKMYWADSAMYIHKIQRANLDGTGVEDFLSSGLKVVYGIHVHRSGGGATGRDRVYWSDSFTRKIQSANLQGADIYEHATVAFGNPGGLTWDGQSAQLFWTDSFHDQIRRASFYGGQVETLVGTGLSTPTDVTIDVDKRRLYWTDSATRKIQRADLNGGNIEDVITSGLIEPSGIDILPAETTTTTTTTTTATTTTSTSTTRSRATPSSSSSRVSSTTMVTSTSKVVSSAFSSSLRSSTAQTTPSTGQTTPLVWNTLTTRPRPDVSRIGTPSGASLSAPSWSAFVTAVVALTYLHDVP